MIADKEQTLGWDGLAQQVFNSSLDGNVRRAIDIREGEKIDAAALKNLICAAVDLNLKSKSKS